MAQELKDGIRNSKTPIQNEACDLTLPLSLARLDCEREEEDQTQQ